jgi:hypothetical protein
MGQDGGGGAFVLFVLFVDNPLLAARRATKGPAEAPIRSA